jgi:hypothetical protein
MTTTISDTCLDCSCQIWLEGETWVDNSGGDACLDNDQHNASGDETLYISKAVSE